PHAAAAARAGPGRRDRLLAGERPAAVGRTRQPDAPILFPRRPGFRCVPGDVDVPVTVGADRTAAVEPYGGLDDVALWLEGRAVVVESGGEHGRRVARRAGFDLACAHPRHVDPAALAHGQIGAP